VSVERNPDLTYVFVCDGCGDVRTCPAPFMAAVASVAGAGWTVGPHPRTRDSRDVCGRCSRETSAAVARSGDA
jgi:hypothetical protein